MVRPYIETKMSYISELANLFLYKVFNVAFYLNFNVVSHIRTYRAGNHVKKTSHNALSIKNFVVPLQYTEPIRAT